MSHRAPSGSNAPPALWLVIAAFLSIYLIWGSTYFAIRMAVETIPPFLMAGIRYLLAGSIVYVGARWYGAPRPSLGHWRGATVVGALLLLGGNGAVVGVAHLLPSGVSALLVSTTPFWMVGLEWARRGGVRPTSRVVLGLSVGFCGLVLLLGPWQGAEGGRIHVAAAVILLCGSLSWAMGSLYSRHASLPGHAFLSIGMQQLAGGAILCVTGLASGEAARLHPTTITADSLLAFLYLVVFGSLVGFTAYIWLLKVSTPARVSTYAYVNPVIAVFLGWSLGGETFTTRTMVAAGVILAAVAVITTDRSARRVSSRGAVMEPRRDAIPAGALQADSAGSLPAEPVLERR